ncbi:RES family NAD+ phosphorylase [Pseudomonas sp. Z1-12]|uniref:RES family NAD+ phosphorylase n=1 Tax=Pseudomonas sp. Z1-12 TaxID=2817408 RepID=UPI003DA8316A
MKSRALSMAKQRTESSEGRATPPRDLAASVTPVPAATLHVTFTVIAKGDVLHRVHQDKYQPVQFNPGVHGNARFSPIQDDQGRAIPTLYGGTTVDCALMETVFHDVPHTAGFKSFDKGKLTGQVHSAVQVSQPLHLVDLSNVSLRRPNSDLWKPLSEAGVAIHSILLRRAGFYGGRWFRGRFMQCRWPNTSCVHSNEGTVLVPERSNNTMAGSVLA